MLDILNARVRGSPRVAFDFVLLTIVDVDVVVVVVVVEATQEGYGVRVWRYGNNYRAGRRHELIKRYVSSVYCARDAITSSLSPRRSQRPGEI